VLASTAVDGADGVGGAAIAGVAAAGAVVPVSHVLGVATTGAGDGAGIANTGAGIATAAKRSATVFSAAIFGW